MNKRFAFQFHSKVHRTFGMVFTPGRGWGVKVKEKGYYCELPPRRGSFIRILAN